MLHCPKCGSYVKEEELYCVSCGVELPKDIHLRSNNKRKFNRLWFIPIITFVIVLFAINLFYNFLQNQSDQALKRYELGEKSLEVGDYKSANEYFTLALKAKPNFIQGKIAQDFIQKTASVKALLEEANQNLENQEFQSALTKLNNAESLLTNFNGEAITHLVDEIVLYRNTVKTKQLKSLLEQNPSIDELKVLLWEADAINNNEATQIMENIRNQIVDFVFTKASEQLSENQFSDALLIVEDGLKYAPNSEKLLSLKTTIEKEKVSFEITQQQRIQQAIDTAEEEREMNENDAIELISVKLENDNQGNIVVKGEVKSVATIPVSSIQVEYSLLTNENEFLTNSVYVYPDTLYPNENGKFEFTHYDINQNVKKIDVNVNKVTWYTNY
ncbi:zinc ribbon domain-containing protein [Ornithinibacillus sp. 179-J 7C1 HS]|uniref:zinc ribbon domain-containing protein n=1 Tax=Ornithinibacillus sp. 179-J 7C1 HS TaxID=3142384 RepID=UPI0039A3BF35